MTAPLIGDRIKILYNEGAANPLSIEIGKTQPSPTSPPNCGLFLKFRPGGDGYLSTLGYSRMNLEEDVRDTESNGYGTDFWIGPYFRPRQEFKIQLGQITAAEYKVLEGVCERSRWDKGDVFLLDQRIAMFEPLPKTRGAVGNIVISPAPAMTWTENGMIYYWAVFKVKLSLKVVKFDIQNQVYALDVMGQEKYPVVASDRVNW
jgi:hypothetical protein